MSSSSLLAILLIASLLSVAPSLLVPSSLSKANADGSVHVVFDKNTGSTEASNDGSETADINGGWPVMGHFPSTHPTKSGNLFDGWFTSPTGGCRLNENEETDTDECPLNVVGDIFTVYAHWLGTDATLSTLILSSGSLSPTFSSSAESYNASVDYSASSITITPTLTQATASIHVTYILEVDSDPYTDPVTSGSSKLIPLFVGLNIITIEVRAEDGTTKTYTVNVTRLKDVSLSALSLSNSTNGNSINLAPTFAIGTESYTASVANSVETITVTATKSDNDASTVQYIGSSGITVFTGALAVGSNVIRTLVRAQDGTTKTYTVTVTRAGSAVATLRGLSLSNSANLSPSPFASGTDSYTASVGTLVDSITVTATPTQVNATITVNGTSVNSGSASGLIPLNVGLNTITVVVTAQDGTTKTYRVYVIRKSNDATLSALTISSGTISPAFVSGTENYTASVSNPTITITPTVNQVNATTVQYLGATGTTPFTGALALGPNTIRTKVTAQNGIATKIYIVTVTRVEAVTYNITWDNQGADVRVSSGGSSNFTTGSAVATIPTTAPQKTGYTFVGWFTGATSGTQVTNGSYTPASPYGNLTFYAKWAVDEGSVKAAADVVAKAAADAAAAQREAEKQSARADVTAKLQNAKDLTPETFAKAEIPGVTTKNIAAVQAELMAMPETARTDINQILKVAHKYEVVGNIGSDQIKTMLPNSFVEIGLIPAESKNKVALVAAIRKLPEASRDTYAEIKAAIEAEAAKIKSRNDRLAAIVSRNSSKNSIQNSAGQKNG